ncbi:uncharacterized protein [Amphiura filiformis]|uniref:uncharacterized protein n=1 Tax=Amphiura filiformis TaxID=82378 RepID=UPI003B22499F
MHLVTTPGACQYVEQQVNLISFDSYIFVSELNSTEAATEPCDATELDEKLLQKLEKYDIVEPVSSKDEEVITTTQCVVCMCSRAAICTYPCGHQVICRRCFVKTIQVAVSQRLLPLRCVLCRAKILRLKQTGGLPPGDSGKDAVVLAKYEASQQQRVDSSSQQQQQQQQQQ